MNIKPFISVLVAFVGLLVALGTYGLAYHMLTADHQTVLTLRDEVQKKSDEVAALTTAQAALATLHQDEATLRSYSVGKENIVSFLEALEASGRTLGTQVQVLSVSDEKGEHPRVAVALSITGSFDAVMRTLGAIEYGPYDGVMTNVTLDTTPGSNGWTAAATYSVGLIPTAP